MTNDLLLEIEAYLEEHHFIKRQYEMGFWLNKSKKYFDMLKSSGRDCSVESAIHLSRKLAERGQIASRTQPAVGAKLIDYSNQILSGILPAEVH